MNKEDFLDELAKRLSGLPQDEIDERITFYREEIYARMEKGLSEEEAIAQFGSVDEVVAKIMSEYPLTVLMKHGIQPKRKLATWEIILLILGSPLLIAAFAIVFSIYVAICSIVVSLFAASFAFAVSSIGTLIAIIAQLLSFNFAGALFFLGASLVCAGLAIFFFIAAIYLAKAIIIMTRRIVLYIKNSFVGKEVDA